VIGAGWAARFALSGVQVTVVDSDAQGKRKVQEVLHNAKMAMQKLIPGWEKMEVAVLAKAAFDALTVVAPTPGAELEKAMGEALCAGVSS
jgi:carnitine 3-dehydrogenase